MVYRTAPFSMTLNNPYTQFQGHAILWRWISLKWYEIPTYFQWNTNRDLHTPYSLQQCHLESPWVSLSDLAKYSMTRSVVRSLCDSWASCSKRNVMISTEPPPLSRASNAGRISKIRFSTNQSINQSKGIRVTKVTNITARPLMQW